VTTGFDEQVALALVKMALREDLMDAGDVTSRSTLPPGTRLFASIVAKEAGVVAGLPLVHRVYAEVDSSVQVVDCIQDGAAVEKGTLICRIEGAGAALLTGERTALNFLQRLSGIASLAARFVQAAAGTRAVILDTRKTTPGWRSLEKYAVRMGGAQNHRMGLYDMVMIKNNHIDGAGGLREAVVAVRAYPQAAGIPIEVEVRDLDELREVLPLAVDRVLLDNMKVEQMREAVTLTAGRVPLEASGNMSLERVPAVAGAGVDFISVGALTHSAPALDLSMRISRS
jgi:nicotinate-nucleotide pyrophosphorylase (carboxylating)